MIRRIFVTLKLQADAAHRQTIERVFGFFADRCPIYKTLKPAIEFHLSLEITPVS